MLIVHLFKFLLFRFSYKIIKKIPFFYNSFIDYDFYLLSQLQKNKKYSFLNC